MTTKFLLYCSCVSCKRELTVQAVAAHYRKCASLPKNVCETCHKPTNNPRFCSASCSAQTLNRLRPKKPKKKSLSEINMERFLLGEIKPRHTLRRYLIKTKGNKCSICNLNNWQGKALTLIVDHVDGDAGNNLPKNLRLLCPNCNSQTETFGGKNIGKGRKTRGLPLY